MNSIIIKSVIIGVVLGAAFTLIYNMSTISTSGRNVMTGEPIILKGYKAIYVFINEHGLAQYLLSLLPTFVVLTLVIGLLSGLLLNYINTNA